MFIVLLWRQRVRSSLGLLFVSRRALNGCYTWKHSTQYFTSIHLCQNS